ncbi:MAG: serine/threonine dehydratase [Methylobacterium sp.]|uniref:threonine ammonia-lyase n=1 Tax=Bosea sp. (in: a-proteobacteria) TaxID=1871050 RepID=UPI001D590248|nr:pyridoxal-phosphate dependent enzyme [Bosea sp. (in: a-proteobacteria)]MBA4269075.1 serine/threonine dehydratase [Methylobacterium sp.]WRH57687.1 MAG: pyridoxal-phosphate dependent enzyme [Bosea sp. (in: a-proteobacteria)]
MIDLADIEAARRRIAPHIRKTPTLAYTQLKDGGAGGVSVTLKLELLQAAGSFKARGAMNRLMTLSEGQRDRGIVTASGGNHGLAIARSAHVLGARAQIFLPSNVVPDKVAKLKQWGASVEIVGAVWDDANAAALAFAERTGATYAHPFSDPVVVAGQGTLGLDVLDDMPDVDVILVAIGGGGLISGLSTAVKARRPATRIIGIEPVGSPTLHACIQAGRLVALDRLETRVATMSCRQTDQAIFEVVRDKVDEIVLVSDEEMESAARQLWFEFGIGADLSGAAALAALNSGRMTIAPGSRVCALVCGAGTDGMS